MADSVQYKSLPEVLYCKTCNYYTCNKKQIDKHFLSSKHIKNTSISVELPPPPPPTAVERSAKDELPSETDIPVVPPNTPTQLVCECCGETYKRKRALLRHQRSKQEELKIQEQTEEKDNNISLDEQEGDNQSLELISDDEASSVEFEYITFDQIIIDPLIVNHDVVYFLHAFIYSIDVLIGISVFVNKFFSFFSLKSHDHSD
jgi:hypothetical protein